MSSHNGVIDPRMFVKSVLDTDQYSLEEGGFYVIQNTDEGLKLVHKFYTFQEFIKEFYPRGWRESFILLFNIFKFSLTTCLINTPAIM